MKTKGKKTQLVRELVSPTGRTFDLMTDAEFMEFCNKRRMRMNHAA
ncbi:MAG: hypothetical protein KDC58_10385 [Cyclobacteriaceae bacterium]|nr:hypothetical protein [Cyclobacteriaceae bacterium]